jgi:hypothetical protein
LGAGLVQESRPIEFDEEDGLASKVKERRKRQEEGGSKMRKREEGAVV